MANTSYFVVQTGLLNSNFGAYNASIEGLGQPILGAPPSASTPEPTSIMALAGLGLLGVAGKLKKKS